MFCDLVLSLLVMHLIYALMSRDMLGESICSYLLLLVLGVGKGKMGNNAVGPFVHVEYFYFDLHYPVTSIISILAIREDLDG